MQNLTEVEEKASNSVWAGLHAGQDFCIAGVRQVFHVRNPQQCQHWWLLCQALQEHKVSFRKFQEAILGENLGLCLFLYKDLSFLIIIIHPSQLYAVTLEATCCFVLCI